MVAATKEGTGSGMSPIRVTWGPHQDSGRISSGLHSQNEDRFPLSPLQTSVFVLLVSYLILAPDRSLLIFPADFLLSFSGLTLHLVAACFQSNSFLPRGFRFLVTQDRVAGQLPKQGRDVGIQTPCAADKESTIPGGHIEWAQISFNREVISEL